MHCTIWPMERCVISSFSDIFGVIRVHFVTKDNFAKIRMLNMFITWCDFKLKCFEFEIKPNKGNSKKLN